MRELIRESLDPHGVAMGRHPNLTILFHQLRDSGWHPCGSCQVVEETLKNIQVLGGFVPGFRVIRIGDEHEPVIGYSNLAENALVR